MCSRITTRHQIGPYGVQSGHIRLRMCFPDHRWRHSDEVGHCKPPEWLWVVLSTHMSSRTGSWSLPSDGPARTLAPPEGRDGGSQAVRCGAVGETIVAGGGIRLL